MRLDKEINAKQAQNSRKEYLEQNSKSLDNRSESLDEAINELLGVNKL